MTTKTFTASDFAFRVKAAKIPQYNTGRLIEYLSSVGYDDIWLTRNVKPLLVGWMSRKAFVTACLSVSGPKKLRAEDIEALNSMLKNLYTHQVKDWLIEVAAKAEEGLTEEGTPEQELADSADYWSTYAGKFSKALLKIRAVKHEGKMLFLADDVAAVYGDPYVDKAATFFMRDAVGPLLRRANVAKNATLKKLTYREILSLAPSSAADKRGMQKGKWFMDENTMLLVLQQSTRPAAMEFRLHLIDVLKGRAENMMQHAEKKIAIRSPERLKQLKGYRSWEKVNSDHGASVIVSNGEISYHVVGMKQAEYCAKHGVEKPYADNLPDEVVRSTNVIRDLTATMAKTAKARGQGEFNASIDRAAALEKIARTLPSSALDKLIASSGVKTRIRA